jgi:hypothetical protein
VTAIAVIAGLCAYSLIGLLVAVKVTAKEMKGCRCGMPTYHALAGVVVGAFWPGALFLHAIVFAARWSA